MLFKLISFSSNIVIFKPIANRLRNFSFLDGMMMKYSPNRLRRKKLGISGFITQFTTFAFAFLISYQAEMSQQED